MAIQTGTKQAVGAVELLKQDHRKVKELFKEFEQAEESSTKGEIAEKAIKELQVHSQVEEEIFYPEVRTAIADPELMNEAKEEHHVVDLLIEEIQALSPDDEAFTAKFTVLAENVKHHIEEEENEMFPEAQKARLDMQDLGQRMAERKQELLGEITHGRNGRNGSKARRGNGNARRHSVRSKR